MVPSLVIDVSTLLEEPIDDLAMASQRSCLQCITTIFSTFSIYVSTLLNRPLDDPVMAAWRFGLGRVAVYTADLRSPWSAGLRRWPGFR